MGSARGGGAPSSVGVACGRMASGGWSDEREADEPGYLPAAAATTVTVGAKQRARGGGWSPARPVTGLAVRVRDERAARRPRGQRHCRFFSFFVRALACKGPPPPLPGRLVAPPASWRGRLTYLPRFRGPRLVRASSPPWYRVDEILPTEVGSVPCGRDHRHRGMTTCCPVQCGQETVVPAPPTRWCPGGGSHLYKRARPRGGWAGGVQGGGGG